MTHAFHDGRSVRTAAAVALALLTACEAAPEPIAGPPCPELSPEAFAQRASAPLKQTRFLGLTLERRHGAVDCRAVGSSGSGGSDGQPLCRLSAPALLHAQLGGGHAYFAPPAGRPVLLAVEDGAIRCVLTEPRPLTGDGSRWRPAAG